ncbi:MAG: hypothetical protein MZW92_31295 [Comamonadaceae bacterium]|nr:hypothetical protein [Comamonadaceae bacterium]
MAPRKAAPAPVISSTLLAQFTKSYGAGSVTLLSQNEEAYRVQKTPTGISTLDRALGGGLPMGKIVECFGPDAAGKTSLALQIAGVTLRLPGNEAKSVLWADCEAALSSEHITNTYKVDPTRFLIARQSKSLPAEVILDMMLDASRSPEICLVVLDSVASLVLGSDFDKCLQDNSMAAQRTALLHRACRYLENREITAPPVLFLNQVQDKLGVTSGYGPTIVTPGGRSLKHHSSLRMELQRIKTLKNSKDIEVGFQTQLKVVKSRYSTPGVKTVFNILYDEGIDVAGAVLDMAIEAGLIHRSGTWYTIGLEGYGDQYQGMEKLRQVVQKDPILFKELTARVENLVIPDAQEEGEE